MYLCIYVYTYICVCVYICIYTYMYICIYTRTYVYGLATISRMLKNIRLFCKRALQKRPVFCKETCIFKHPTNRSHPIVTERCCTQMRYDSTYTHNTYTVLCTYTCHRHMTVSVSCASAHQRGSPCL